MSSKIHFEYPEMSPHQRLWELILHISKMSEGDQSFGKVKLAKILYFADSTAFLRTGKPITGAQYKKLPYGPVPDELNALLDEMASSHAIAMREEPYFQYKQIKIFALKEPSLNTYFTAEDIALIDEIIHEYWNISASDISDISHGLAWKTTPDHEAIPYEASLLSDEALSPEEAAHLRELAEQYG